MRIILLNYEFPPLGGGAGNAAQYIVQEFKTCDDLSIDVVTSSLDSFKKEQYSNRITIHRLNIYKHGKNRHHQSLLNIAVFTWKSFWYIRRIRKQHHYDGIHAFFGMPCGLVAALHRIPYIVSLRGSDVPLYNPRFYLIDLLLNRYISTRVWKRARAVTPNSFHLRDLALRVAPQQPMTVVPNGVDTDVFHPIDLPPHPLNIVCVARLVRRKHIRAVVEAAALLSEERQDFTIQIIGDGEEQAMLECVSDKLRLRGVVQFLGAVNHDDIAPYYQRADVFILPSLNEGMSNSLLEALASGLVIISTPTGDAATIVDASNGVLVPFFDSQAIAAELQRLLDTPAALADMKQASRAKALSLTWKSSAESFLSLYKQSFCS